MRAVMSFLHADYAESAEFFIFFSVLRWRWRGRKLRYDERAQRGDVSEAVYYLLHCFCDSVSDTACRVPTCKSCLVSANHSCPRVAMGIAPLTRHRSTFSASSKGLARPLWEGWGGVHHLYAFTFTFSSYPLPLRVLPLSQGEKGGWEHFL